MNKNKLSTKIIKATTAVAASTAMVGGSVLPAFAEGEATTVVKNEETKETTLKDAVDSAKTELDEASKNVDSAKADYDAAQAKADEMNKAAANASEKVDSIVSSTESDVNNAQTSKDTADSKIRQPGQRCVRCGNRMHEHSNGKRKDKRT